MEKIHLDYYRTLFASELRDIELKIGQILEYASKDDIKLSELNRNMKAINWLSKTYANNIELYDNIKAQ